MAVCCFTKFFKCRVLDYFALSETVKEVLHWPKYLELSFQTAQMSVLMVFGGHHLPICLRPGGRGGRKQIGRQEEGFSLFGCAAGGARGIQYMESYLFGGPLLKTFVSS